MALSSVRRHSQEKVSSQRVNTLPFTNPSCAELRAALDDDCNDMAPLLLILVLVDFLVAATAAAGVVDFFEDVTVVS